MLYESWHTECRHHSNFLSLSCRWETWNGRTLWAEAGNEQVNSLQPADWILLLTILECRSVLVCGVTSSWLGFVSVVKGQEDSTKLICMHWKKRAFTTDMTMFALKFIVGFCLFQGIMMFEQVTQEDMANWTIASKYHWGQFEACSDTHCGKPPYHIAHAIMTWVGDGPKDCYGKKVKFVCDCEKNVPYTPSKYDDIWLEDSRRQVNCMPAGSWSNSPSHDNPCPQRYCVAPSTMAKARYKIKKQVRPHPDIQTPDQEGKYCPGSTARYFCDECHSGGGNTECLEDTTWRYVEPCTKIPDCKASKTFQFLFQTLGTETFLFEK